MTNYNDLYQQSISDPEAFWGTAAEDLHWYKKWDKVIDIDGKPVPRWFVGGEFNTCYNAIDRHVEAGRGEQTAIIYDSPITDQQRKISYADHDGIVVSSNALAFN